MYRMGHAGSDPSRVSTRLGVRNSTFHQYLMARGAVALRACSVCRRGQSNRLVERHLRGGLQNAVMKAHLCRARRLSLGVQPNSKPCTACSPIWAASLVALADTNVTWGTPTTNAASIRSDVGSRRARCDRRRCVR